MAGSLPVVGVTRRTTPGPVVLVPLLGPGLAWVAGERLRPGVGSRVVALGGVGLGLVVLLGGVRSASPGTARRVPLTLTSPGPSSASSAPGLVVVVAPSASAAGRLDVGLEKLRVGGWQHWIDEVCEVGSAGPGHVVARHGGLEEAAREVL